MKKFFFVLISTFAALFIINISWTRFLIFHSFFKKYGNSSEIVSKEEYLGL